MVSVPYGEGIMFGKKVLAELKKELLEKRASIMNRSVHQEQLTISTDDLADDADHAAAVIQQGVALEVLERDRLVMKEIDRALSKFEDGTYGFCEDTEEPIDVERLKAQPWTRYSVEAAEERENKAKRFKSA